MLRNDVKFLKRRYAMDAKGKSEGRLVLRYVRAAQASLRRQCSLVDRNEVSSDVYTTDVIMKMFKEEGGSLFDSRSAALGHTLQGGIPSPMDRARAVRLSLKSMAFIERHHQELLKQQTRSKQAPPESAAVITIQGTSVQWVAVQDMVEHADMTNRRGKHSWWEGQRELVEALVARPQILAKKGGGTDAAH